MPSSTPTGAAPTFGRFCVAALLLGLLGFGGGWVVMGWIRRRFVSELGWLSDEEFLRLSAVASALPGTNGPNLLALIGHRLGGVAWAVAAPVLFVVPSAVIIVALAASYDHARGIGLVRQLFDGMGAAVAGVVLAVAIGMRRKAASTPLELALAVGALLAMTLRLANLLEIVLIAGAIGAAVRPRNKGSRASTDEASIPWPIALPAVLLPSATAFGLFVLFARVGAVTFGGGYAMISAMHDELVSRGWVDEATFSDAIAVGQITPGPVALAGTFLGYRVAGLPGAVGATAGMFLSPLCITLIVARSLERFRHSELVQAFLRGVGAAVIGVIAASSWAIAQGAVRDTASLIVAMAACVYSVLRPRTSPVVVLFAGAIVLYAVRRVMTTG